jgi:hypothetical protein
MNSTDPVGVPPPEPGATVAVIAALWPSTAEVEVKRVEVGVAEMVPCSARVWFATALLAKPTAQQFAALVQATALRMFCDGLGFGVVTIDQSLPFHSSARVCSVPPLPVDVSPTAQQSEVPVQVTP